MRHEAKHAKAMIAPNLIELGHINESRVQRIKSIYQSAEPALKGGSIEGVFYSEHLVTATDDRFFYISLIGFFLLLITLMSFFFAIKWRRKGQVINEKLSSTSRKLETFQEVIMHKLDTTLTNDKGELTFISESLLLQLGYTSSELIGKKKTTLYATDNPERLHQLISSSIKRQGLWQGEMRLLTKVGQVRVYDCLVDDYCDSFGVQVGYISLHIDQTEKMLAEKRATIDGLTALANRRALDEKLQTEIQRANRFKHSLCVIFLDIDYFKKINDEHGHIVGDKVLQLVADTLQKNTRQVDTVGRWGGEEFLVICPVTDLIGAKVLANSLREKVAALNEDGIPRVKISGGIASYVEGEDVFSLMERADKALYTAKRNGRDRVVVAECD